MATKAMDESIARKEQAILWKAFQRHNMEVAIWVRKNASEVSTTTWSAFLHHGKPVQLKYLMIMCHELEIPMKTLKAMLKARGEGIIAHMLKGD